MRKIKSHENFSNISTAGGGTKPLADLEKRKKGKLNKNRLDINVDNFIQYPKLLLNFGFTLPLVLKVLYYSNPFWTQPDGGQLRVKLFGGHVFSFGPSLIAELLLPLLLGLLYFEGCITWAPSTNFRDLRPPKWGHQP